MRAQAIQAFRAMSLSTHVRHGRRVVGFLAAAWERETESAVGTTLRVLFSRGI